MANLRRFFHRSREFVRRSKRLGIPPLRSILSFARFHFGYGHTLENFFIYRLYDPKVPDERKNEYLPRGSAEHVWSLLNPPYYAAALTNKFIFHSIAESAGLKVPKLYGIFDAAGGFTSTGKPLQTLDDLSSLIEAESLTRLVLKPVEGMQARYVYALEKKEHGDFDELHRGKIALQEIVRQITDKPKLKARLLRQGSSMNFTSFLVQERLSQHAQLEPFAGPMLSPVRILTLVGANGQVEVLAARLHLLDHRTAEDANDSSAIDAAIDLDSGIIYPGVSTKAGFIEGIKKAPAAQVPFAGETCPCWEEAKALALEAASRFSFNRAIGWDVAITPDGPVLLEGNARWGFTSLQASKGEGLYKGGFKETYQTLVSEMPNRPRRTLPLR